MDRRFRTSLDDFALDILNLVAARLREAQESVTNRRAAIVEADGGLHARKPRLREEDETKLAKLMLVFDIDLDDLQKLSAEEFDAQSRETLKRLDGTFPIFGGKLSA